MDWRNRARQQEQDTSDDKVNSYMMVTQSYRTSILRIYKMVVFLLCILIDSDKWMMYTTLGKALTIKRGSFCMGMMPVQNE